MTQRHLRDSIPRTFDAFFDRFPRLLAVQRQAIPPLADGRDVLVGAPTAGGKTEAVLAPLLHRVLAAGGRSVEAPALVYVTPTRALVNDVYRRLQVPVGRLGLGLGRKTGDHPSLGGRMPQVLVTTPESLDSMLARTPKRLLPVQALVLDELHALDGTPRGDQLAALVVRLRRVRAARLGSLQVAMLSATVERPSEMAARYAIDPVVVRDPRRRPMRARLTRCFGPAQVPACLGALVAAAPGRRGKVLVFANARADVELLAREERGAPPFGERVYAHHGSLSKPERERVERDFHAARTAVCFATSTLELGIDIGDVDWAVLYGVPPDIPSFLQRVGRAGRRDESVEVLALARDQGEVLRLRHMFARAREGRLLTDPPVYDPGTALQQAASLSLQNPGHEIAPLHVLERLPAWQREWWSEERLDRALQAARRWFAPVGRHRYRPTEALDRAFEVGTMHTNIAGDAEVEVLDELTGRRLGTIAPDDAAEHNVLLAGAARAVRRKADGSLVARSSADGEARFERRPMRAVPGALASDLLAWLDCDPAMLWRVEGPDETVFLHGLGTLAGSVLHASAGEAAAPKPGRGVAFGLRLRRGYADWPAQVAQRDRLLLHARSAVGRLARQLGFGPWFRDLPPEERERAVVAAVAPDALAERLARAEVRELYDDERRRQARWLVAP